jgi:hypothetical protein
VTNARKIANDGNIVRGVSIESNEEERRTFEIFCCTKKEKKAGLYRKKERELHSQRCRLSQSQPEPDAK